MRYALLVNGIVDVISFEPQSDPWIEVDATVFAGFILNEDGTFSSPPPPPQSIPNLSFAQLLIGLVGEGWISEAEGEEWLKGNLPPTVLAVIDQLPPNQRFVAKARATRPTEVVREDPLVNALASFAGKTPEELDQFFQMYSQV